MTGRIITAVAVVASSIALGAGRTRQAADPTATRQWSVPRTADGHPDLQGDWNHSTITPLERLPQFAGRPFMSEAEAAAFERETFENLDARDGSGRGQQINEFWFERGRLARIDGRTPTSLVVEPGDGRIPAATAAAQARAAQRNAGRGRFDGPSDFSLSERCLRSGSGPPLLPGAPDANLIRIVQSRDHIAIVQEKFHETRIITLDGRAHISSMIRTWVGDSRGRWEGDTLVVDTTNFTEKFALGSRYDGNLRLIERFTRVGPDSLVYEFIVNDPTAFTGSWRVVMPLTRTGEPLYEFACHEGNYSLPNILRGARAQEAAALAPFSASEGGKRED